MTIEVKQSSSCWAANNGERHRHFDGWNSAGRAAGWEIAIAVRQALAEQDKQHQADIAAAVKNAVHAKELEHAAHVIALEAERKEEEAQALKRVAAAFAREATARTSPTTVATTVPVAPQSLPSIALPQSMQQTCPILEKMQAALKHLAGRHPASQHPPVTISKTVSGVRHLRMHSDGCVNETMVVGGACSELFSGPVLGEILEPGVKLQQDVVQRYLNNTASDVQPLFIHTSAGIMPALGDFTEALQPHLPASWGGKDGDWMLSLQLDGASAVHTAYDMLLQLQHVRGRSNIETGRCMLAAVGARSYHGPGSTSFGSTDPLHASREGKRNQISYPVPAVMNKREGEGENDFFSRCLSDFASFLDENGEDIAVLFIEPQWGSSVAAQPWPKQLLRDYISLAQSRGILVCADEIMCGLGRHGQGKLFVSNAWDLNVDAITFGKAVASGTYPLSGVALKSGAREMEANGRKPMQSHTYAHGAQALPLMAATQVLRKLPMYFGHVSDMGSNVLDPAMRRIEAASGGAVKCHGQGLMWGGIFASQDADERARLMRVFKERCEAHGVLPYFVPVGGFMVTPPLDVTVDEMTEALRRLEVCVTEMLEKHDAV